MRYKIRQYEIPSSPSYVRAVPKDSLVLSVTDVASALNRSNATILKLLHNGDIQGRKIGRQWAIPRNELERLTSGRVDL